MKLINKQLIAVAQFIFSVLAGFAFGFIGVELIVGNLDFGFRLLLGIMCSLIIALAEIYFLAKKLNEDYDDTPAGPIPKKMHQDWKKFIIILDTILLIKKTFFKTAGLRTYDK